MAHPRGRLIIVCELPGSGKTTRAKELAKRTGGVRFSPDDWMDTLGINLWELEGRRRVEALQWRVARDLLSVGGAAIIEWGTWSREERETLRQEAVSLGAWTELVHLTASRDVLFARISARGRENPPITRAEIGEWCEAFEAPTADELALYDPHPDGATQ